MGEGVRGKEHELPGEIGRGVGDRGSLRQGCEEVLERVARGGEDRRLSGRRQNRPLRSSAPPYLGPLSPVHTLRPGPGEAVLSLSRPHSPWLQGGSRPVMADGGELSIWRFVGNVFGGL